MKVEESVSGFIGSDGDGIVVETGLDLVVTGGGCGGCSFRIS